MPTSRNYILALTATVLAAGLAIRRRARLREAVQDKTDVQTWENEGGTPVPSTVPTLPS